ncbi:MAG: hypothetical protein VX335_04580 [Pseudomonadota bacterium]|nr:hypothetical protein [Pseudomonadota bacterium]
MLSILGTGSKSTKYIAKSLIKRCSDVHDVALFSKRKELLAYAKSPTIEEIEKFRTISKTRLVACLFMFFFILITQISYLYISFIFLVLISYNTFYGWEKYSVRCLSTFAMNALITVLTFSVVIYVLYNLSTIDSIAVSALVPLSIKLIPLVTLSTFIAVIMGYLTSLITVGDITVFNKTKCLDFDIDKILENPEIDKYIVSKNGDFNMITNVKKKKKEKKNMKLDFTTKAPESIKPLDKK